MKEVILAKPVTFLNLRKYFLPFILLFYSRVMRHNLNISRQPYDVGRYTKLRHPHALIAEKKY